MPLQEEQGVLDVREESSNFTILAAGVDKARGKLITRILKYLILDFPENEKKYVYRKNDWVTWKATQLTYFG